MFSLKLKIAAALAVTLTIVAAAVFNRELPTLGANGLLHPNRRAMGTGSRDAHPTLNFAGADVTLAGWHIPARSPRRGTVVYLHGVADNRGSALTAAQRFPDRGFDVVAYDSRAHGESGGDFCTYGFNEKRDLRRVIDRIEGGPVVVIGSSLGAAVGLQAAAEEPRIRAVVAAESFSDLRTVASERAPWFFTAGAIRRSFALAEQLGDFQVEEVSPVAAAARIQVPVFLIHGAIDRETPPDHSRRIFDALGGPKRLLILEGAGHNQTLQLSTWTEIENWLDAVLSGGND
jgi:pimeloyl-ACP methyl ester carboxylesterase